MNNLTKTSFLLSRPYFLAVYSEIIAHLSTASNNIQQRTNITCQREIALETIAPEEIAYLQNKEAGVLELVCLEMIQMGFIQIKDDRLEVVTYFENTSHLESIEQAVFDLLSTPKTVRSLIDDPSLQSAIANRCNIYRHSLVNRGYIKGDRQKYLAAGMSGLLLLGLTVGKPLVGILAGYRYLLLLVGALMPKASLAIAATAWLSKKSQSASHLTARGKEYLANLKEIGESLPELLPPPTKPDPQTSLLVALYGLETISQSKVEAYANLFNLFSTG